MAKVLKVIERIKTMDQLIRMRRTGNPKVFADKLGISRSHLFNHLEEIKDMGVEITYNRQSSSYEYSGETVLEIVSPLKVKDRVK